MYTVSGKKWPFLPRDAMHMLPQDVCRPVRPSVRPSHAGILSKRLDVSSNFFHQYQTVWQYSDGDPLTAA